MAKSQASSEAAESMAILKRCITARAAVADEVNTDCMVGSIAQDFADLFRNGVMITTILK